MSVIHFPKFSFTYTVVLAVALTLSMTASAKSSPGIICQITTTPLVFGEYVPYQGRPLDLTARITVTCNTSRTVAGRLNGIITLTSTGTSAGRQLKQGLHALQYQMYLDPARSSVWGDSSGSGVLISGIISPNIQYQQTFIIYGRIPAMQLAASGNQYTDYVSAILDY